MHTRTGCVRENDTRDEKRGYSNGLSKRRGRQRCTAVWKAKGNAHVAKESSTEERGSVDTHTIVVMHAEEETHPHARTSRPHGPGEENDVVKEEQRKRCALLLGCVRAQARFAEGKQGEGTLEAAERWVEWDGRCERAKDRRTHTHTQAHRTCKDLF